MFTTGSKILIGSSVLATVAAIVGMDHRPEQVTGRGRGGVADEVDALVVDLVRRHGLEG